MKTKVETPWDSKDRRKRPGLVEAQIRKWETQHGVWLPGILREALRQQNGGLLRYSDVRVNALEAFKPPDEDFWEYASYSKKLFRNAAKVFFFAEGKCERMLLLNYNENGPRGEPTVWHYYSDPGEVVRESRRVKDFFSREIAVDAKPKVNWSETEELSPILHQETIEQRSNKRVFLRQTHVLGRLDGRLVHFRREVDAKEERLVRTVIPEPLDPEWASINAMDPTGQGPFEYQLQPVDSQGMQEVESVLKEGGVWKNAATRGGAWVGVESASQSKLQALRVKLLGKAAAGRALQEDQSQSALVRSVRADPKSAIKNAANAAFDLVQSSLAELKELSSKLPGRKRGG